MGYTTTHKQRSRWQRALMICAAACIVALCGAAVWQMTLVPRHDRAWEFGQERTPRMIVSGNTLTVENFRDFAWRNATEADARWSTKTFDLAQLMGVDVVISHFSDNEGVAHIFLTFRFADSDDLVISVEARRDGNEAYSPWKGMWRQYEMLYVAASERDVIGVRISERDERVYVYPTIATSVQARQLLTRIATDATAVADAPQFYHTLWNSCLSALAKPAEEIAGIRFPFSYKMLLPGYADEVLYDMGVISHDAPFAQIKERHRITQCCNLQ